MRPSAKMPAPLNMRFTVTGRNCANRSRMNSGSTCNLCRQRRHRISVSMLVPSASLIPRAMMGTCFPWRQPFKPYCSCSPCWRRSPLSRGGSMLRLGILPPLIYSAGVAMSWREFRFNLRLISLLVFGAVVFTTCAVAAVAHWLLGMRWAIGFLLGAIVSPPDAVAPLAIVRRLGVPRRLVVVLEGEGLANDATALILYRFAVAAVSTGLFSFTDAAGTFVLIVAGEIAYGIAVGWLSLRLRRWARDPRVEITLSLLTPYLAFLIPQELGGSGVLATVATGLFVSWNGPLLIPAATRLQGIFFWDLLVY